MKAEEPTSGTNQPPDLSSLCLAITEHAPLPMATVEGASHIVRYVNPAFCRLMDKPMEQLVGKPFCELLPENDECLRLLDCVFRTGKPESHTEEQHSKPHLVFWSYTMWPVMADERPVGVMMQVTETAQFHEKTLAMNEALMLGSVRQHELADAAENLNEQLRAEITERKQAEQRVRTSEIRYRRLFEAAQGGILILDPKTRKITEANPYIIELLGYPREQLLGKELWEIGLLKDKEASQKAFLELKAKGFIRYESLPLETKADQRREVEFVSNLYQENGEAVIQCNIRDVTERKQAEQELSEKARLLDLSNDAIIVHDLDDKISSWNKGAEDLYGWTSEEVIGKHLDSLLQMEFPKPMEEIVAQLQSEGHFSGELVQIARDGRRVAALCRWVLDRGTKSILTSYTDISERKRNEEAVREAAERFRFMAESMPQKIFTAKPNGNIDYFNQQWMEFTGLTFEQIKDWGWKQFIHPDDVEENVHRWQHSIDTGEPFEFEHRFRRSDGVYRWHLSRAFPMRDAEGRITMWIGSNTDIEDQKRTEETLRESETQVRALFETAEAARLSAEAAKMRAEGATRAKDDFLAALSHELRTPLSPALLLATSLADDVALPPNVREDIDVIAKGIALQAQLVDDMLDITRITTGKLRLNLQPIDAHAALRHAYEIVRAEAQERKIEVTFDLAAAHNCIEADAVRVQQIFWNVLKNAVKFSLPGGAVTVGTRNPAEKEGMLVVEITDAGIGIEPEMVGKIFGAFVQEEHDGAHRFGGIGLGLAITHRLVELQGGQIYAESGGHGRGATFRIELPLEVPELSIDEKPAPAPMAAGVPTARRILLVEDHEQTRSTLVQLLERRGHSVVGVTTAANAREIAAANDFDLVISDLGLPDGDGHKLMTELRDAYGLPGLALSGYGMGEDLERSRASGFFTHLTKPVDIHALDAAIAAAPAVTEGA